MSDPILVIKRGGKRTSERFDKAKLKKSIAAACLSVRTPGGEADQIAENVAGKVSDWCDTKPEVTSSDLRRIAAQSLEKFHPEAAYLYKHHRLVL